MAAIEHGTNNAYANRKCRCPQCKQAAREYDRARRGGGCDLGYTPDRFLSDLLHELAPNGLTDDCPARKAKATA